MVRSIPSALFWAVLAVLLIASPGRSAAACAGDCDDDGTVSIAELVTLVNIALNGDGADRCAAGDVNGDGRITIEELITAVNSALLGCPSTPTASPTAAASALATATASATPTVSAPPPTETGTATPPVTPSATSIATPTQTFATTATATGSPTTTASATRTPAATETVTPNASAVDTATRTATPSGSPAVTSTASAAPTDTTTATLPQTPSASSTVSQSSTVSATRTSTATPPSSATITRAATRSATAPSTGTATRTLTASVTATHSRTGTATRTRTPSATATRSATASRSRTSTISPSPTRTTSATRTPTATRTGTSTRSATATPSASPTGTATPGLGVRHFSLNPASSALKLLPDIGTASGFTGSLDLAAGVPDPVTGQALVDIVGASEFLSIQVGLRTLCIKPLIPVSNAGVLACNGGVDLGITSSQNHRIGTVGVNGFTAGDCAAAGGVVEGAADPHPGVCNGPVQIVSSPEPDSGAGALLIAPDDRFGTQGLPAEVTIDFGPCSEHGPGEPTLFGFASAMSRATILNANNVTGAVLEHDEPGENFSCASWTQENGPGRLVLSVPAVHGSTNGDLITVFVLDD